MRVLHVVEVTHGGVPSLVRTLVREQGSRGIDVHVMLQPGLDWEGTLHPWTPRRRDPVSLLGARRQLVRAVRAIRPDVVHLHSFFPGLIGRGARLPAGTATVYQPHSWAFQATASGVLRRGIGSWEAHAARTTDAIVTNCADEREEGRRAGVSAHMHVVGVPVDVGFFAPVSADRRRELRRDLASRYELDESGGLLVCVGRISNQKGQDQLVRSWEERPVPGATLVLVGPGPTERLADLAPTELGRTIRAVGAQDDVRPWLHAADVLLQPSRYEGQSVAMAEALACGVPVVMTDVNGVREAVSPPGGQAAGAVVPVADMQALLAQAERRLLDESLRLRESKVARSRAEDMFGIPAVADRIQRVYAEAVRSEGRQRDSV